MTDEVTSPIRQALERVLETPVAQAQTQARQGINECSICRREHGPEIVHASE